MKINSYLTLLDTHHLWLAVSTNFLILIVARIMQGVGASMFAISFSIIRDKFTPEKLAVAQGIFSSMFSAGAVIGVAIGGTIINNSGWHATFFLVIPIAIALFVSIKYSISIVSYNVDIFV